MNYMINTYTDSSQLMCILCRSVIRSKAVWSVHLNSKIHKENIVLAKKTKLETQNTMRTSDSPIFKRPSSPSQNAPANKKIKSILKNSSQPIAQTKSGVPADFFDSNVNQLNGGSASMQKLESKESVANTLDVQSIEVEEEKEKVKDTNVATLPEGFFDDPVMDAKVRYVK